MQRTKPETYEDLSQGKKHTLEAFNRGYRIVDGEVISPKGKMLTPCYAQSGYKKFGIRIPTISYGTAIMLYHCLAAFQKFGDKWLYSNYVVRHLDGDYKNNNLENIEIGTQSQNILDIPVEKRKAQAALIYGKNRRAEGVRKKCCKCNIEIAETIRKDAKTTDMTHKQLGVKYNLKTQMIANIVNNRIYKKDV